MQLEREEEKNSDELLFLIEKRNRNKPIYIAILVVILMSAIAITGVYLEYW